VGDDIAEKYLLLSNSHDGTSSVQIKFTPVRVVCQNTLTMALRGGPPVRVVHLKDMRRRLRDAERMLHLVNTRFEEIEKTFQAMAGVQMNQERLSEYVTKVFPDPLDPEDEQARKRVGQNRQWAEYFFAQGKGNEEPKVRGTLWAAYNGIAEYIDQRQTKQLPGDRLDSVWFGEGYYAKARAYRVAEGKLNAWRN